LYILYKRRRRLVRWTITTSDVVLLRFWWLWGAGHASRPLWMVSVSPAPARQIFHPPLTRMFPIHANTITVIRIYNVSVHSVCNTVVYIMSMYYLCGGGGTQPQPDKSCKRGKLINCRRDALETWRTFTSVSVWLRGAQRTNKTLVVPATRPVHCHTTKLIIKRRYVKLLY